ncbi:MHFG family PEP-CTERM protein [Pseudoduganella lutea]|uniref:PEP-CTERM sorting domain-containing protein n=1 Tax=Pseudoduganella lutea TaxID=321985 RepID=A0A4P6L5F4_9BURK|nr:MHFG family PEP-CTERM protein [Pseudoduganella lutea]QBE66737.1 PEP-CTERM sorting domain-containing protein [Pseudoduganella lutea]
MSTLVASAVVATAMLSNCSWNSPGRNPYRGSVSAAVSRYVDIPAPVRTALVAKIEAGRADDAATIGRDHISGRFDYDPYITGMHFGQRTVCDHVTRDGWSATAREPAKVYCVGDHCLIVPQICSNISRVRRVASGGGRGTQAGAAPAALPAAPAPRGSWIASPDDVAAADAMAQVAGAPAPSVATSSAFMSPFGSAVHGPGLTGRNPFPDTELAQPAPVPEPATLGMLGAGLALVYGVVRLRSARNAQKRRTAACKG